MLKVRLTLPSRPAEALAPILPRRVQKPAGTDQITAVSEVTNLFLSHLWPWRPCSLVSMGHECLRGTQRVEALPWRSSYRSSGDRRLRTPEPMHKGGLLGGPKEDALN